MYSAWRLAVDAAVADASSVCLFEARQAVGGRTYSVDVDGLTVDIGAYRFGMSMHLPADLIVNHFKLETVCYEPSCSPDAEMNATLYRIVDADGHNAGYATPVRAMLREALGRGVRVFYRHELTGIYDGGGDALAEGGASLLHFAGGGGVVRASAVLLNLPRQAVERLDPASVVFDRGPSRRAKLATTILTNCTPCQAGPVAEAHEDVKVYAIYDHPWWVSKLGLAEGTFASVDADPPLVGRYHDGPIRRRGKEPPGPAALEAVYTFTLEHPQVKWYLPFVRTLAGEPLTVTTDPALLLPLHTRLMDYHRAAFAARGCHATAPLSGGRRFPEPSPNLLGYNASAEPPPREVVLGIWTTDKLALLPSPTSSMMHVQTSRPGACPAEPCLRGVTPRQYVDAVATPNSRRRVQLARQLRPALKRQPWRSFL